MDELERVERGIKRSDALENPISIAVGAVPYFLWCLAHGGIGLSSWIIPFLIGGAIAKLGFAWHWSALDRQRRALQNRRTLPEPSKPPDARPRSEPAELAELPEARVIRLPPAPEPSPIEPTDPKAGPRLLT